MSRRSLPPEHLCALAGRFGLALGLTRGRCLVCGIPALRSAERLPRLCPECLALLAPRVAGFCPLCGEMERDAAASIRPCRVCQQRAAGQFRTLPWQGFCFYGEYFGPLRACILAFKMRGRLGLGCLLQGLMLEGWRRNSWRLARPELIVPVPLHPQRLRMRGFNQSVELARPVARKLKLPLALCVLRRVRHTIPQFQLDPSQRASNIRGAFAADAARVASRRVLLVDDIMTTGATLEECASVLRMAGASRVDVMVLARTARQ